MKVFILVLEDTEYSWMKSIVSVHETYESASKDLREIKEDINLYSIQEHAVKK